MAQELTVGQLETGSTWAFLQLGLRLADGGDGLTESHLEALSAALTACESMESRVYFSPAQGQFIYLPPLSGAPLFAALYGFSKALTCKPFAEPARDVLKKWVDGDARTVGLAMAVLKWGADFKHSLAPESPADSKNSIPPDASSLPPTTDPPVLDLEEIPELLLSAEPGDWARAFDRLMRTAEQDGASLSLLMPALVNALAAEYRDRVLGVLAAAVRTGLDVSGIMPLLAGLLVDRDYYDAATVGALYRCLTAAAESGADISAAWPYVPLCMDVGDRKLLLIRAGAARGQTLPCMLPYLFSVLQMPIVPESADDPEGFSLQLERVALALEILTSGARRGELLPSHLDGGLP